MSMDVAEILKPLDDVIEKMQREDDPVRVRLARLQASLNHARARVGLPPIDLDTSSKRDRRAA
jgi:hypothetical protein